MIEDPTAQPAGVLAWWMRTPLYLRILGAVLLGVLVGVILGDRAAPLETPSKLLLQLLKAIAPPLILLAIIHALLHAQVQGKTGLRLVKLLLLNTLVAIGIGLFVANVMEPGKWTTLDQPPEKSTESAKMDPIAIFIDSVPKSLLGPFGDNGQVIGVIFVALAFGIALRRVKHAPISTVADLVEVGLNTLIVVLHWIIQLIPFAVFGIVASIVGVKGFGDFIALGAFVVAVLVALSLQAAYYLLRIRFGSWVRPRHLLRHTRDALVMAFSTGSSTATMPVTYECLVEGVGLRKESASLGALVGANFNNDGTALYEAMSALFVAQMLGMQLTLPQQAMVVLTSVIASVGAAGIPEAGLVTMTLVFNAVGLPINYILVLLTVDWFLDRCRTAINVMGDMNVACLLDGVTPESTEKLASAAIAPPDLPSDS